MAKLVCCSSCSTYILPGEAACPFCGARPRTLGLAVGAVAVGLALGGCGSDDDPDAETINSAAAYGVEETVSDTEITGPTTGDTEAESSSESGASSSESSSGSTGGTTDTGGETDTDTDTGSTSLEPDYGVPTTTSGA